MPPTSENNLALHRVLYAWLESDANSHSFDSSVREEAD